MPDDLARIAVGREFRVALSERSYLGGRGLHVQQHGAILLRPLVFHVHARGPDERRERQGQDPPGTWTFPQRAQSDRGSDFSTASPSQFNGDAFVGVGTCRGNPPRAGEGSRRWSPASRVGGGGGKTAPEDSALG